MCERDDVFYIDLCPKQIVHRIRSTEAEIMKQTLPSFILNVLESLCHNFGLTSKIASARFQPRITD